PTAARRSARGRRPIGWPNRSSAGRPWPGGSRRPGRSWKGKGATDDGQTTPYEMALFLGGAVVGDWVRPARAGAAARAFRFRGIGDDGRWPPYQVTQGEGVTRCTCPGRAPCAHVRALRAFRLID